MQSLMGKTAIVAGASSGMGRATALALASDGMWVMAAARRAEKLAELDREENIETLATDLTDRAQVERLVSETVARFGGIDLLVYAAGDNIQKRGIEELTPETWSMMLDVNLTGAFHCTQAVLPVMRAAGGGLIVYISSISAHEPDVSGAAYQAAKRGLAGLAHATRVEEKLNGIRTSVILPGLCRTELIKKRPVPTPAEVVAKALLPEDVAEAVLAVARLHPRAVVPELEIVPSGL
jgi:NADP-dependent 3-hydroxy acid dehydrogenase YdfG